MLLIFVSIQERKRVRRKTVRTIEMKLKQNSFKTVFKLAKQPLNI